MEEQGVETGRQFGAQAAAFDTQYSASSTAATRTETNTASPIKVPFGKAAVCWVLL